ncbi:MAG TPA: NADH-quinone oxidoreductase subunit N [Chthoniobacterales bacterium]|jgi:NADH-quinone oxidoreductase subunit N|nr:NADH-quinone oxidoreductase subunit N [Chthoniobacterales bacterium]
MSYLELLKLAAPEAIVVLTALMVLTIGLVTGRRQAGATVSVAGPPRVARPPDSTPGICALVAALGLAVAAGAIVRLPGHAMLFHGMLVISPLNSLFQIICLVLAFFTVLLVRSSRPLPNHGEYLAILLLGTVGLLLLVGSEELLMIFIGLELTGLSLYIMTAFDKTERASAEAGMKYFLFGSMASAVTLFGLSLVYGLTGTTSLAEIAPRLTTGPGAPLLAAGIIMSLIGFAFKVAAAPFHLWAPDVYQGAPVSTAAFIASGSKVASFVVLGKIVLVGFAPANGSAAWHAMVGGWTPILALLAALSILLGNFVALVQKNVRRLLAYSAVAHGGYTLLGLVTAGREGFSASLFYTTIYAVTLVGAFGVVGFVRRETGGDDLLHFAGLRDRSPLLAGCMAIFMLSLAGLPPLAGFFGKFYLFSVALRAGENHGLLWLVVLALFGSLISLYYYLIVLKVIFLDEPMATAPVLEDYELGARSHFLPKMTLLVLAAAVLLLGILPGILVARILASFG